MALSRKYYKMIARCIKDNSYNSFNDGIIVDRDDLIDDLCVELKRDNINFNYTMFKDACQ